MSAALEVRDVAKAFGKNAVLKRVDLRVGRGELVGIEGENGAGKSTLLSIVVGRLAPSAGEVRVDGRLGYCPQDAQVFEALTVRENFRYFAEAYDLPKSRWEREMDALLESFRFARHVDFAVAHLSGGTRQKLNLALALLHAPDVLVLDEPYAGFDWDTYLRFWDVAAGLRDRGASVIVVSHLVYDRSRFDRVLRLVDGELQPASEPCA